MFARQHGSIKDGCGTRNGWMHVDTQEDSLYGTPYGTRYGTQEDSACMRNAHIKMHRQVLLKSVMRAHITHDSMADLEAEWDKNS